MYAEVGLVCTVIGVLIPVGTQIYKIPKAISLHDEALRKIELWQKGIDDAKYGERIAHIEGRLHNP